jgi:succinate dehydrogenase hydrophobic anchor subunit
MSTAKPATIPLSKRGFNFEIIMWIFTRLSVLAMYALILAGLVGALIVSAQTGANLADVLRWAFFPNMMANPLSGMPWVSLFARLMVTAFVLVLSAHGVHGIIEILDDYVESPSWQRIYRNLIIAFFVIANLIAIFVIWTSSR